MQRILLLDNFDSFTYNLAHYLRNLNVEVDVVRNNVPIQAVFQYDKIVLSPGPGLPNEAGNMMELLQEVDGKIPVLGVCLGMQAIALHLGGELYNLNDVKHGVQESVTVKGASLFEGVPSRIDVGLYHSWAVRENSNYEIIATSDSGVVMAIQNLERKLYGVQFHPESIMTPNGLNILENFVSLP